MKTYEIMERIDKLGKEMLNKKYKLIDKNSNSAININEGEIATIKEYVAGDGFLALSNGRVRIAHLSGLEEWEELKGPISFMELIEEIRTRPGITFKYSSRELNYHNAGNLAEFLFDIADGFLNETIAEIISEGEFYIED